MSSAIDTAAQPEAPALIDFELSALVYLLTRCAQGADSVRQQLALQHLEQMAVNHTAPPLLRRTAARLARQWHDELRTFDSACPGSGDLH